MKPPYCIEVSSQFHFYLVCDFRNGTTFTSCRLREIHLGLLYAFMVVFIYSYFNDININKDGLYTKHFMDNKRQWKLFTNVLVPTHLLFLCLEKQMLSIDLNHLFILWLTIIKACILKSLQLKSNVHILNSLHLYGGFEQVMFHGQLWLAVNLMEDK